MFCPKCRSEYREGFTICADCNISLVAELEDKPDAEFIEYGCVLLTFNLADIAFISSLLDSEGITYYWHGEHFSRIRQLAEPARLMVKKDQVEIVKDILKDMNIKFTALNLRDIGGDES